MDKKEAKLLIDKWVGIGLIAITSLNVLIFIFEGLNKPQSQISEGFSIHISPFIAFDKAIKIRIIIALLIGTLITIAMIFNKVKAKLLVILLLLWIVIEYVYWWIVSYKLVQTSEAQEYGKIPHTLFLYNATWWDLALFMFSILFLGYFLQSTLVSKHKKTLN